ncbi:hypothetical protein L484_017024 [Morus notabilis]|uniref:Uncharacterized protein n=1 Tax=Morus notabilis TaxID=981085 RepID=W9RLE0_9ROSA|nr:hypothetical protein L484_017024 [Morus notabilis]
MLWDCPGAKEVWQTSSSGHSLRAVDVFHLMRLSSLVDRLKLDVNVDVKSVDDVKDIRSDDE